jgi:membrane fusion protein, heavy metal efflux system
MIAETLASAPPADGPAPGPSAAVRIRHLHRKTWVIGALCGAAALVVLIWSMGGVSGSRGSLPDTIPPRDVPFVDGKLIRFSESFARRTGISAVPVQSKILTAAVNVTGTVTTDVRNFSAVGARVGGRVRRIFKVEGDQVRAREVLAEIDSGELGRAEAHVLATRAQEMAAEAHKKRERQLADAHVASEREAELAQAEHDAIHAEHAAAERALVALGGDLEGELGVLTLRSPISGTVIASRVARGQTVEPSDTLFEVANLSTLWVELSVFERDLAGVRAGDSVLIGGGGRAHGSIVGQVAHVGEVIDLGTRSAPVRVVIQRKGSDLRPGQSVEARIQLGATGAPARTVPRVAVTRIDGKPMVLVLIGPGVVEPREVKLGAEDDQDIAILEGLRDGERVVAEGLFALKSELYR